MSWYRPDSLCSVLPSGGIRFKSPAHLIANLAENWQDILFGAFRFGGVNKPPMMPIYLPGKEWAHLVSMAANGDNSFNRLV